MDVNEIAKLKRLVNGIGTDEKKEPVTEPPSGLETDRQEYSEVFNEKTDSIMEALSNTERGIRSAIDEKFQLLSEKSDKPPETGVQEDVKVFMDQIKGLLHELTDKSEAVPKSELEEIHNYVIEKTLKEVDESIQRSFGSFTEKIDALLDKIDKLSEQKAAIQPKPGDESEHTSETKGKLDEIESRMKALESRLDNNFQSLASEIKGDIQSQAASIREGITAMIHFLIALSK